MTFGVGSIKLSFRAIVFTQYMHAKMFSIQMLLYIYTFQSNCAESLHFSAFHYCSCPVCMCVHSYLPPHTLELQNRDTNGFIPIQGSF